MKQTYRDVTINDAKADMIDQANDIIATYQADGYDLTLRQLYYQFVARDLLPKKWADPATGSTNNIRSYKKLGEIISDGRYAGRIDWAAIKDRTRELGENVHWRNPAELVRVYGKHYRLDTRIDQENYIEVWVEKDALEGVIERSCRKLDVPWLSCRGYVSASTMQESALRLIRQERHGKDTIILHFGDHDPSGIDMTRDMQARLAEFGSSAKIVRIALNMDQVEAFNPPPNPAKETDSRFKGYIEAHGEESWELDALDPHVITDLIEVAIGELTDESRRSDLRRKEEKHKIELRVVEKRWSDVIEFLNPSSD